VCVCVFLPTRADTENPMCVCMERAERHVRIPSHPFWRRCVHVCLNGPGRPACLCVCVHASAQASVSLWVCASTRVSTPLSREEGHVRLRTYACCCNSTGNRSGRWPCLWLQRPCALAHTHTHKHTQTHLRAFPNARCACAHCRAGAAGMPWQPLGTGAELWHEHSGQLLSQGAH